MREYLEAIKTLAAVTERQAHLNEVVGENPFAAQIAHGVMRNYYSLNLSLEQLLAKPLPGKHADLRLLLLAGLYSVQHLKRPPHASVNAAVDAAEGLKKAWAKGLVNGVLRQFLRDPPETCQSIEARLEHPGWLIEEISDAWPDRPGIFHDNNLQAPLTLRVNLRKISRDDYLALLAGEGVDARVGRLAETAVTLANPVPVGDIPGFNEGLASVQDEAPQLAASLLDAQPGMTVLDACAAPGGKTCHLLEHTPGIKLTAIDADRRRMGKLEDNLRRLGESPQLVESPQPVESLQPDKSPQPASCRTGVVSLLDRSFDLTWGSGFDRVLLDVPCSATGVIRRHPDIKLLRKKEDVDKLCELQRALLDKAFDLLAPGGELLYCTCSILPRENEQAVADFLGRQPDASVLPVENPETSIATSTPHGLQLFPGKNGHDGFFYARIRRSAK